MENNNTPVEVAKMLEELRELTKKQITEAYLEGAKHGVISTLEILYNTFIAMGIAEDNLIFDFLKDLAKKHGCEDLKTSAAAALKRAQEHKNASTNS